MMCAIHPMVNDVMQAEDEQEDNTLMPASSQSTYTFNAPQPTSLYSL